MSFLSSFIYRTFLKRGLHPSFSNTNMSTKTDSNGFLRFLKDEKFIEWKLFPSEELDSYWKLFLENNPWEKGNMVLAEKHFRHIKLSSYVLPQNKKEKAIEKLEQAILLYRRKRKIRSFIYIAAACIVGLMLSIFYFTQTGEGNNVADSVDYIVGNELQSEDIQLIANNQTVAFDENVDIQIDRSGIAQVKRENRKGEEVAIDKNTLNRLVVPYGKRSVLKLSDNSKVWLNSGSILEFSAQFSEKKREIHLISGEIYIEIAPDKKREFQVHTSDFQIKVYGTKFNVSTYEGIPQSVVLVEGSVGLKPIDGKETHLSPNEQAVYSHKNRSFDRKKVDVNEFISWKNGYLVFEDTPITEVLKQIERYYNLSFNYDKDGVLKEATCTGKIVLSENLENVMTTIALISSTKYKKENNRIYITNESD